MPNETATACLSGKLAALWGEPEQAVHGMKGKRETILLVIALNLRGVYSRSSDLRCLSSSLRLFSGQPSSLSLFCTRMLGGSWEPEATLVLLGYLSSCSSSMSCFLLFLGLLSLCCFWSAVSTAQSAVMFDSTFSSL